MKIKVIDSIMGSGKSTFAIQMMQQEKDKSFIYITPYLNEIKRVKDEVNPHNKIYEPLYRGGSKQENLHKLLIQGRNIASTHALFQKANEITKQALQAKSYTLILDEVMNVVEELSNFTSDDVKAITISEDLAYVKDDYLVWNENKMNYDGRYNDIKEMALNGNLLLINNRLMFWNFPVDIFDYFEEVYILTYKFDAQIQKYYYDFHELEYELYQMENWKPVTYRKDRDNKHISEIAKLITIHEGKMNSIGEDNYALSLNWYKKDDEYNTLQTILKNNISNWFNNMNRDIPSKQRMWTTFKSRKGNLKGKGYTSRFVSLNARATNDYNQVAVLAYCSNRFIKPTIIQFFEKRGIKLNQDEYALSEMLQWIWRSRIRNGEPIDVYIPSSRMRNLLKSYLQL